MYEFNSLYKANLKRKAIKNQLHVEIVAEQYAIITQTHTLIQTNFNKKIYKNI